MVKVGRAGIGKIEKMDPCNVAAAAVSRQFGFEAIDEIKAYLSGFPGVSCILVNADYLENSGHGVVGETMS